jgi:hypothetical protein
MVEGFTGPAWMVSISLLGPLISETVLKRCMHITSYLTLHVIGLECI